MHTTNSILIVFVSMLLLTSCGKDNKNSSPAPAPVIGTQNLSTTNILAPFDPSFESLESASGVRRLPNLNARYFRVTSSARSGNRLSRTESQIISGTAFTGDKSLQLFNSQNQSLSFPLDTQRKGRPLNLIPGARYRVSAKVRLPRGNQFGSFSAKFTALLYSENRRISNDKKERSYPWPQDGSWLEIAEEFETPSLTQKGSFNLSFNGTSDIIIDELQLIRIR